MSIEVDWTNSGPGYHIQELEYSKYVTLDTPSLTAAGIPAGVRKFAELVYVVNPSTQNISLSAGDLNIDLTSTDAILTSIDNKTPAYGTAGTPSADVLTIQGVAGADPVLTQSYQKSGEPSTATPSTSAGDVFTLAAGETGFIRNLGTNVLYYRYATGCTSSEFHDVLAPGGSNDDGFGGAIIIDDFIGTISVAGTSPRFIAWKR